MTTTPPRPLIYGASRVKHAAMWRALRADGHRIVSTWIDEDTPGATLDRADLINRCLREPSESHRLVWYIEGPQDFPFKLAWGEVCCAIVAGVPVYIVAPPSVLDRDLADLTAHPMVVRCTMGDALCVP